MFYLKTSCRCHYFSPSQNIFKIYLKSKISKSPLVFWWFDDLVLRHLVVNLPKSHSFMGKRAKNPASFTRNGVYQLQGLGTLSSKNAKLGRKGRQNLCRKAVGFSAGSFSARFSSLAGETSGGGRFRPPGNLHTSTVKAKGGRRRQFWWSWEDEIEGESWAIRGRNRLAN